MTHNSKLVAGQQPSAIHDRVCVSGVRTGVICGIQIAYLNVTTGPDQMGPVAGERGLRQIRQRRSDGRGRSAAEPNCP
jgi:hypothetical protein